MKSAKDKAIELCRKLGLPVDETENGVAYQLVLATLQDHEIDTRQACVEALVAMPRYGGNGSDRIILDYARIACMNAKVE